jgi:hypothetical protein
MLFLDDDDDDDVDEVDDDNDNNNLVSLSSTKGYFFQRNFCLQAKVGIIYKM